MKVTCAFLGQFCLPVGVFMLSGAVCAATWNIVPTVQDGRTPTQQLTNAVTRAASGDTIAFAAGTYQLDGQSFMRVNTCSGDGNVTITSRNYLSLAGKTLNFVGETNGTWDDTVVLRGNGNDRFLWATTAGSTFAHLTFENFAANDRVDTRAQSNNLSQYACGGAIFLPNGGTSSFTNCVFRGNQSRTGGALHGGAAYACLFTNNVAVSYNGGAVLYTHVYGCTFSGNTAQSGGAAWWPHVANDCLFENNQSASGQAGAVIGEGSTTISNCVFRGNQSSKNVGGALSLRPNMKIMDCTFEENSASSGGGAIYCGNYDGNNGGKGCKVTGCTFLRNEARGEKNGKGGAICEELQLEHGALDVRDCTFTGNTAAVHGGACYGCDVSNCTFTLNTCYGTASAVGSQGAAIYCQSEADNVVDFVFDGNFVTNNTGSIICSFSDAHLIRLENSTVRDNYIRSGGIVRGATCTNVVFQGNEVPGAGGMLYRGTAVDCRFVGNRKYDTFYGIESTGFLSYSTVPNANLPSGDAKESVLLRCDMDLGCLVDSVLVDCRIHTLTNLGSYCVFYGHNVATNCLIDHCQIPDKGPRGLIYRWGEITPCFVSGSEYVNCTFADNRYTYFLFHAKETGIATAFRNCLFYNNCKPSNGAPLVDVNYAVMNSDHPGEVYDSGLSLSNCVFGTPVVPTSNSATRGDTWHDLGGNRVVAGPQLKLALDNAVALGVHRYCPRAESPVLGMGDPAGFSAADVDYAGNLRLRDGRVDPGCFECWLNRTGTMLLFR